MTIEPQKVQELVGLLKRHYPNWTGFQDANFAKDEITYKRDTITKAQKELSAAELKRLLDTGAFDQFISRLEAIGRDNNLLYRAVPATGDLGILYRANLDKPAFCRAMFDLLHGPDAGHLRLTRFTDFVKAARLPNKWTFPTYFLFVCHPESEMFIKPRTTRWFLEFAAGYKAFASTPTPFSYVTVKQLAEQLLTDLREFSPRDMVDVQSFIWVCALGVRQGKADDDAENSDGLPEPFASVFKDKGEAEWAFAFLKETVERLGVKGLDDSRVALTLPRGRDLLRLNFGQWMIVGLFGPSAAPHRAEIALLTGIVDLPSKYSAFARGTDEPEVRVCELSVDALRAMDARLRSAWYKTLDFIAAKFRDWKSTPFRNVHQAELFQMVFDEEKRKRLLAEGLDLPETEDGAAEDKRPEFARLFAEFAASYPNSPDGQRHIQRYPECRQQGEANFQAAVASGARGEDITDFVLLKLLPYENTAPNRERGAWIHIAPSITKDIKSWFEGAGWTKPEDWPKIAQAILGFVQRCVGDPSQLPAACAEFASLPFVKGLQTGMLTPILNALRPDDFLLVNTKSRKVINYFGGTEFSPDLLDYPDTNAVGKELLVGLAEEMKLASGLNMRACDLFDMFSHWLVAVKGMPSEAGFWKIAPGDDAWHWDECREKGFIAIGWDELGDVSGLSRAEFSARRDEQLAKHSDWNKNGVEQVWKFSRIEDGDRVVANRGTKEVLGIGTVTGPYYFVPGERHGHRLPVKWDDVTVRGVDEGGWRRTLIELDREQFETIRQAGPVATGSAPVGGTLELREGADKGAPVFTAKTFELLAGLHETPTRDYYAAHKAEFKEHLEEPFRRLFENVRERVREEIRECMETEKKVFSRILKNDYGGGGAWEWLWGAFYPKGGERTKDVQLWVSMHGKRVEAGFSFGEYSREKRKTFLVNLAKHREVLASWLEPRFAGSDLFYGSREELETSVGGTPRAASFAAWAAGIDDLGASVRVHWPEKQVLELSGAELSEKVANLFNELFPLVLLAIEADPLPAIRDYLKVGSGALVGPPPPPPPPPAVQPEYQLATCAADTGFDVPTLESWVRAVSRKGQAIIYGPPGTGKTFMAEKLAAHLIGGGDGFSELVQFHPAYAYEDFMQGLRPQPTTSGGLHYPLVPGRFLEFCNRAATRTGLCVLIIDEINRANLSRVFGELMYLLEYRKCEIPLAGGGTFRIPEHVRLIGTMNTADRSIALVDHALRRRFGFIALYPRYEVLREFHAKRETGFATAGLIEQLKKVNEAIADPHYHLGLSFFLRTDLAAELCDIWQMEIEPYLEEFFFDQPEKFAQFRWENLKANVLP